MSKNADVSHMLRIALQTLNDLKRNVPGHGCERMGKASSTLRRELGKSEEQTIEQLNHINELLHLFANEEGDVVERDVVAKSGDEQEHQVRLARAPREGRDVQQEVRSDVGHADVQLPDFAILVNGNVGRHEMSEEVQHDELHDRKDVPLNGNRGLAVQDDKDTGKEPEVVEGGNALVPRRFLVVEPSGRADHLMSADGSEDGVDPKGNMREEGQTHTLRDETGQLQYNCCRGKEKRETAIPVNLIEAGRSVEVPALSEEVTPMENAKPGKHVGNNREVPLDGLRVDKLPGEEGEEDEGQHVGNHHQPVGTGSFIGNTLLGHVLLDILRLDFRHRYCRSYSDSILHSTIPLHLGVRKNRIVLKTRVFRC